jgi:hypothetical protein
MFPAELVAGGTVKWVGGVICTVGIEINNLFSRKMQSAGCAWIDLILNGFRAVVVKGSELAFNSYL